jgi:hypothetical protein
LWQGLADPEADDAEVTFGIKAVGEVNYEVKLKWSKKE